MCSVLFQSTNRTTTDQGDVSQNPDLHFYQMIYGVMVIVMLALATIKCFFYTHVTLNASCKFHDNMFRKVMWCGRNNLLIFKEMTAFKSGNIQ